MRATGVDGATTVIKRSVSLHGHHTSVSLEKEFWQGLREIAEKKSLSVSQLIAQIDRERKNYNLSSAIRVFVYHHFRYSHAHESLQLSPPPRSVRTRMRMDNAENKQKIVIEHLYKAIAKMRSQQGDNDGNAKVQRVVEILKRDYGVSVPYSLHKTVGRRIREFDAGQ
jgi:predicted DNA-binding ribbon-helix-helix protein